LKTKPKRVKAKESFPHRSALHPVTTERDREQLAPLEARVRDALAEPAEPTTLEDFKRRMERMAKQPKISPNAKRRFWSEERPDGYINDFHRERSERLKTDLARQPKVTLKEALEQYDRIKRGSRRRREGE
jgi:hypothetical protein